MIQSSSFFVLRRPTYSLSKLAQFYSQLATRSLDDVLRQYYQDPLAQEALFAASPALYERFRCWLAGEQLPEQKKLLTTLHKYFIRMCSRSTPYGLFAGCAMGTFSEQSHLRAGSLTALQPYTRVDTDCLQAICTWLTEQPIIRRQLQLWPNSSLYPVGSSLRYVEQQRDSDKRHYFISAVETDDYINLVLDAAQQGATIDQLAALIPDVATDEATDFIEQLIDSQILSFDIEPTVTGINYLERLTNRIAGLSGTTDAVAALHELASCLKQPDRLVAYAQTRAWFAQRELEMATADVVQVDSFFQMPDLSIGQSAMRLLQHDLEKLLVLNQPATNPDLDVFKRRFDNRYEEEEISLSLALDSEFGIGYGSVSTQGVGYAPLIDDLTFGTSSSPTTTAWDWWQALVMEKYTDALRTRQQEIVLTDEDLAYIRRQQQEHDTRLPDSFYAFGSMLARSEKALDDGDFQFNLLACSGPSAVNLLSRFGEGDPHLAERIRACSVAEEQHHPDVIIAEIVHLPENRVGNILTRPMIHQYEIPYLGQSSVDPAFQIPLSDLMVSVNDNRVVLRSKRLNKRVIPRLTTAHNFTQGLPIYRFLCDLQRQDAHLNIVWNWGVLHQQAYLPRVRYNRVILNRATWQLQSSTLSPDNPLKLVAQLTAAGVPDQFAIAQADNELMISMHVPASLDLLIQEIRKNERIRLVELLNQPEQCPLMHQREAFAHEVVIPFYNDKAQALPGLTQPDVQLPQRRFSVGSEWFYLKIYTGEKASDELLIQSIYPTVQQLLQTQIIQAFFYIRYQDTDPHLRLRFRGNPHVEFYQYVVRAIEKAFHKAVTSGVVNRVQVDTYQRELERYGMEQIERCEQLFHYDSLSTMTFLANTDGTFDEDLRFAVAIAKIDRLLAGLSLPIGECRRLLSHMKEQFFEEFGGESSLRHQLNDKYRFYRSLINQAVDPNFDPADGVWQWQKEQTDVLQQLATAVAGTDKLFSIAGSLIHMIVNRLFPSKQRVYELVLYHCLSKHYDSVAAQKTGAAKQLAKAERSLQ
ncbi:lantibiotic dehydratase [Fibrella aquatilis]|uniref:Lantibiotic dehydratase n=1 Tax=Fibrella aquatilis TaxID=2817059 RepID=A0A939G4D1_9BACT|nr:lantibiotic dehydratase [Fibrella aquatilis]MBO0932142.1 lantibiotic dehydratase [Fibrella aquatilis]